MADYIFGIHSVNALLLKKPFKIIELYIAKSREDKRVQEIILNATKNSIFIHRVDKSKLDGMVGDVNHQGVVAKCEKSKSLDESDLIDLVKNNQQLGSNLLFLVLDNIQDPHNLGACLRSADCAGVDGVIIPKDNSCGITPVVRKVASGAAESVDIFEVGNLSRVIDKLKDLGIWFVGTSGESKQSIYEVDLKGNIAIVMGTEGTGIRRLTLDKCDYSVYIPMKGSVDSLNVSVATGVCLFEALRQRI